MTMIPSRELSLSSEIPRCGASQAVMFHANHIKEPQTTPLRRPIPKLNKNSRNPDCIAHVTHVVTHVRNQAGRVISDISALSRSLPAPRVMAA